MQISQFWSSRKIDSSIILIHIRRCHFRTGTHEDERTVHYETKSLDGTKPNTNPNPKLTQILTLIVLFFFRSPSLDVDVDVDRVDERRPKPLCPHRINTLQYTSLLILGDIKEIEKVQKRATKLIIKLKKNKPYRERLFHLNLPTLKYRRLRGDMIEVFKITHNIYDEAVSPDLSFYARASTRGNNYKLVNHSFHYDLCKHFFCMYCTYLEQSPKFNC